MIQPDSIFPFQLQKIPFQRQFLLVKPASFTFEMYLIIDLLFFEQIELARLVLNFKKFVK